MYYFICLRKRVAPERDLEAFHYDNIIIIIITIIKHSA